MADCCSGGCSADKPPVDPVYRRILWIASFVVSSESRQTPSSHAGCWPVARARSHVWVVISET